MLTYMSSRTRMLLAVLLSLLLTLAAPARADHRDGFLRVNGKVQYPIGSYETPGDDVALKAMADAGINLFRCGNRQDLDRVQSVGAMGWVALGVTGGPTDALRKQIESLQDHPALALWEGPDEIVWNFTAFSGLAKSAGFTREEWWGQKPKAVNYARNYAQDLMPKMNAAIALVKELDQQDRPFWINEAGSSDVKYCRMYMDSIDITGCDYYPVRPTRTDLERVGRMTKRWLGAGRGKAVYMVLQAFSWHYARPETYKETHYPTFTESRFMAYDAIVNGAAGVLYWGSFFPRTPEFQNSWFALTSELATLHPFLVRPDEHPIQVNLIEAPRDDTPQRGVRVCVRRDGDEWLVMLVNEDAHRHLAVEVTGLDALNGRRLDLLYGDEVERVRYGELLTRLQAYETKVFATGREWESKWRTGREFVRPAAETGN